MSLKTRNVSNVLGSSFTTIDRLWAENGIVKVQTKDGNATTLTVEQAAQRAQALNRMNIPDWYKKNRNDLVERIVEVCREAKHQQEDPSDKKTEMLANVLAGKSADGSESKESVDQQIQRFMFMFTTITQKEAEAVASNADLDMDRKERLLKEMHRQRMIEIGEDAAVDVESPVLKD